jgi:DNA (cytosine-5)-methyltransferase 1
MRVLDLFSGIGGFALGFERAGFTTVGFCEVDQQARAVLSRHFPSVPVYEDVHDVNATTTESLGRIDCNTGGFPCQDVSVAGRRAGLAGERSGLWFEFHRVIAELRPGWVVIENVPGLLSSNEGRDFAVILRGLVERGYGVAWRVLDAQFAGVPQRRRRVFIVGHLGGGRAAQVLFERESYPGYPATISEAQSSVAGPSEGSPGKSISHALTAHGSGRYDPDGETFIARPLLGGGNLRHDASSETYITAIDVRNLRDNGPVSGTLQAKEQGYSLNYQNPIAFDFQAAGSERTQIDRAGDYAQLLANRVDAIAFSPAYYTRGGKAGGKPSPLAGTLQASDSHQGDRAQVVGTLAASGAGTARPAGQENERDFLIHQQGVRRLTPIECERLQGFPDDWTDGQSDTARYRQLGNAVAVPVVQWIASRIMQVEQEEV